MNTLGRVGLAVTALAVEAHREAHHTILLAEVVEQEEMEFLVVQAVVELAVLVLMLIHLGHLQHLLVYQATTVVAAEVGFMLIHIVQEQVA